MPAYNAARTLQQTFRAIPHGIVDDVILVDDKSRDNTTEIAKELGIKTFIHKTNRGYGANQKTCYQQALNIGADIVIMLHPDYQYDPRLITAMSSLIGEGIYDVVLGSRFVGTGALEGGMPVYKYIANRFLTLIENWMIGQRTSEYHSGYRAFSRKVLATLPVLENSDDFVFDNQMLLQVFYFGFKVGEISCPARYNKNASSINFQRSVKYGFGVLGTSWQYMLAKAGLARPVIFRRSGRKLTTHK